MAEKFARLTHNVAIQLHLVTALPFADVAPGGQSGNFRFILVFVVIRGRIFFDCMQCDYLCSSRL